MLPKSRNCLKAVRALFFMHNLTRVFGQGCLPKTAAMYCSVYPFWWGKVNGQCINQLLIVSSTKNSKILIILKEVMIRPLFKDPCHTITFQNNQALQRTTFSCKLTENHAGCSRTSWAYFRIFRSPFVPYQLGVGFCSTEWEKLLSYQLSILLVTDESRCLGADILTNGHVLGPSGGLLRVDRTL